jgi:type I restriction enzyme R subunit
MLNGKDIEVFEREVKEAFIKEPGRMKLLIVVDKLLTGFDAPSATYLYIDKSMRDHGLFQAICRVNRLDGDDKEFGYIVDYMDLFKSLEKAVADYTAEAFDAFEKDDIIGLLKSRASEAKKRLEELLEGLKALCEPVKEPRGTLEFIRYFCFESEGDLEELKENEPKRLSLYSQTASLLRAFAEVADNLEELEYASKQIDEVRSEVRYFTKVRDEIKLASCDYIDLKKYEADMRHLIDNYINADESKTISAFDDLTLIELIVERGIDFVDDLPEGIRKDKDAAAEVIENNVRRKIIEKRSTNPLYYEKMSELLKKIIEERKIQKAEYKEYLQKIVDISNRIQKPEEYSDYPDRIRKSSGMRALYDNISKEEDLILTLHCKIIKIKPDKWLGDRVKEKIVQKGIYAVVEDEDMVERTFEIVKEQAEYR